MSRLYKIKWVFEVPDDYKFDADSDICDFFDLCNSHFR